MPKQLKELEPGDRICLIEPDGIGVITEVTLCRWARGADGPVYDVQFERIGGATNKSNGYHLGYGDDEIHLDGEKPT